MDTQQSYTYEASFLSTWLMTSWTILFLPLYAFSCLISGQVRPAELAIDIKDSVLAFRDKGFTLGTVFVSYSKKKKKEKKKGFSGLFFSFA